MAGVTEISGTVPKMVTSAKPLEPTPERKKEIIKEFESAVRRTSRRVSQRHPDITLGVQYLTEKEIPKKQYDKYRKDGIWQLVHIKVCYANGFPRNQKNDIDTNSELSEDPDLKRYVRQNYGGIAVTVYGVEIGRCDIPSDAVASKDAYRRDVFEGAHEQTSSRWRNAASAPAVAEAGSLA